MDGGALLGEQPYGVRLAGAATRPYWDSDRPVYKPESVPPVYGGSPPVKHG
jgi:hypothetical protein